MCDRINPTKAYGEHINLTCRNHPSKRWSTKNIAPLGSRTIFYNLYDEPNMGNECSCPLSALVIVDDK
jgi:hypothetical protein